MWACCDDFQLTVLPSICISSVLHYPQEDSYMICEILCKSRHSCSQTTLIAVLTVQDYMHTHMANHLIIDTQV